jgi:hypothetical protein
MRNSLPTPWHRARRCPLCRKAGCLISSPTDPAAAICRNVASTVPIGTIGHLHELRPSPAWAKWRRSLPRLVRTHTNV